MIPFYFLFSGARFSNLAGIDAIVKPFTFAV